MFGKDSKKKELIKNLGEIYTQLQREHQISPGDFPDIKRMQVRAGRIRTRLCPYMYNYMYNCMNV